MKRATGGGSSGGRPGPYDIRDRGANRGGNDFGGRNGKCNEHKDFFESKLSMGVELLSHLIEESISRNLIFDFEHFFADWGNNSNFGVGANNMLGFNNLPSLMNSGNFGNNSGGGGGGGNNGGGGGGGGGNNGNNGNFGQNSGNFGNFGNDFGDFNNFGNNRNNNNGNNFGKWQIICRLKHFRKNYHGGSNC